jgi:glutamyl-tRNA reductase
MAVSAVGISHRTAPLEVRERFAIPPEAGESIVQDLVSAGCAEAVLLSTCNRTELYLFAPGEAVNAPELGAKVLCQRSGLGENEAGSYLYTLRERKAVQHLFRVVSSLDSMIVGEAQIQGQVKAAYGRAVETDSGILKVGPVLARLFETALHVGARVRRETKLGEGAASIPSAAVELARKVFGSLEGRRAIVLGAGEMAALTLECLRADGVRGVIVSNRTELRGRNVAERFGGSAVRFDQLPALLTEVDLVATATAAPHPVLTHAMVEKAVHGRRNPLVILDIALPRDVEPEVGSLPRVFLYDLDDLSRVVAGTLERRRSEMDMADSIIDEGVDDFWSWYDARSAVPVIRALRGQAEDVRQRELQRARRLLRNLSDEEFEAVDVLTQQLLAKLLHTPTTRLREAAANGHGAEVMRAARYLFSLEDERDGEGG